MNLSSFFTNNSTNSATAGNVPADVYTKVSKIMQAQNTAAPKLNAALTADKTTFSGLGQLQSALTTFQSAAQALCDKGLNLSVTSSAQDVLTAATSSRSVAGTYDIQVKQLAQSQVLSSKILASQDAAIGSGATTLSFDFGKVSGSTFATNTSVKTKTVVIPDGTNTLQGITSAVNAANIGVTASVIPSGAGYALELRSPSGAVNSMRIGVSGNVALQGLLAFNPVDTKNLTQTVTAQNAVLSVNGVTVESTDNSVGNALPGTTLSLNAQGTSKLVIAQGATQFTQNVTNLVSSFNALSAKLNALRQGDLKADGSAARIQNQLASMVNPASNSTGNTASLTLAKIGIVAQKNGDLAIDAAKLQAAISTDPLSVAKLFTDSGNGIADKLASQIQGLVGSSGSLPKKAAAINQDITMLNMKKSSLEKALTTQTNALIQFYSQQSNSTGATQSSGQSNQAGSLFDLMS